ncbi:T9SS type A sorting domain-containing protein [candidate division WOR-3 bacterium]|nr:T9SS type A sorting domain-containing protein [candidate division WOR-3 bacterium]
MTCSIIFLLFVSAAPYQSEFDKAMQLFSTHYNETIYMGEVSKDTDILSTGLYSQKGCHCEYSSIFSSEAISSPLRRGVSPKETGCVPNMRLPSFVPLRTGLTSGSELAMIKLTEFLGKDSLIIGDTPGETLFISGAYSILMDVYIINDGVMLLRNANLSIEGNIFVVNKGTFDCDSSEIHFLQDYIYQFIMFIADSSTFIMRNSSTKFNGFPINLLTIGDAHLVWENLDNEDWTTAVAMGNSIDSLYNVNIAGEWLLADNSLTSFKNTETLLVWYFFPDSSIVDFAFPDGDTVNGFVFDSTLINVSGLAYHTEIDSCTDVLWGMIPLAGSDVTIRNSELRTTGLMFNTDSSSVSGLVNGLTYDDFILPLQDRVYHLINTFVNTWSFYPADTSYLEVISCIFGECVGMGNTEYLIQNAFCDGSGGHIETTDNATGLIFLSSLICDVITKSQSILIVGYSSILLGNIWATGSSIMLLVNASIPDMPEVFDTSLVFIDAITGPSTANTYETVPVIGSATVLSGPFHPAEFDYYELFYRELGESLWIQFDSTHHSPVYNGTLGFWDTDGLVPGYYELQCHLFDTFGNNIEALKQVNLLPGGIEEQKVSKTDGGNIFSLLVNRKTVTIKNNVSYGNASLYDVSGRCIRKTSLKKDQTAVWSQMRSGVYFVRFETETRTLVKKVVLF